jgi:nitrite reductase (NADH) small subunit
MGTNVKQKYFGAKLSELEQHGRVITQVKGMEIGIFLIDGLLYAWRNICPHAAAPVCEGRICGTRLPSMVYEYTYGREQEILRCPWHGWEFDLKTGVHLADGSVKLRGYEAICEEDNVYLML